MGTWIANVALSMSDYPVSRTRDTTLPLCQQVIAVATSEKTGALRSPKGNAFESPAKYHKKVQKIDMLIFDVACHP